MDERLNQPDCKATSDILIVGVSLSVRPVDFKLFLNLWFKIVFALQSGHNFFGVLIDKIIYDIFRT